MSTVIAGEAHSEWNRLVRGNNYSEPTNEQVAAAESICEDLWQTADPSWWDAEASERSADELTITPVDRDDLTATDLRNEATKLATSQAYRIDIAGHAEAAQALYDPESGRIGIAWGADAGWSDVLDGPEATIELWWTDDDAYNARA